MYNPYEEVLRRRQQYPPDTPTVQPPAPMPMQPAYGGPELMPWMQENQQQANDTAGAAGAGLASLIKRFKQPASMGEHGPR